MRLARDHLARQAPHGQLAALGVYAALPRLFDHVRGAVRPTLAQRVTGEAKDG